MTEPTVLIELGGRQIKMRGLPDGALVVLARVGRGMPSGKIENADELPPEVRTRLIRNLGTLGRIIDQMIVQEDDREWLEDAMINGTVSADQVVGVIRRTAEALNAGTAPAKKAAPVRRARR